MLNRAKMIVLSALALMVGLVSSAHAALPTEASAAFTALSGNVTDILAAVWPIVTLAVGGFVLISLFKRGASKI